MTIDISFNGKRLTTQAPTLATLLHERGYRADAAMACAVNGLFVPRAQWAQQGLRAHDRIDVVAPVTGG
jgi:sulfur carrier protein